MPSPCNLANQYTWQITLAFCDFALHKKCYYLYVVYFELLFSFTPDSNSLIPPRPTFLCTLWLISENTVGNRSFLPGTLLKGNSMSFFRWTITRRVIRSYCISILAADIWEIVLQGCSVFRQSIIRGVIRFF